MGDIISYIPNTGAFVSAFVGIVLGVILLVNGNGNKSKKILASYFFLCAIAAVLGNIHYTVTGQASSAILDPVTILCQSLILPILILYARELFSHNWVNVGRGFMLYLPIILYVVIYLTLWVVVGNNPQLTSWADLADNISNPLVWMRLIAIAISLFYCGGFITTVAIRQSDYKLNIQNNYSYTDDIDTGWLKGVSYLFFALTILFILGLIVPGEQIIYAYALFTFVIWIVLFVKGVKQGNVEFLDEEISISDTPTSNGLDPLDEIEHQNEFIHPEEFTHLHKEEHLAATTPTNEVAASSYMSESGEVEYDIPSELRDKIVRLLNDEKVYLNPDLSLQQLAIIAGSNRSYVSKIINETFKVNFFDLINRRRVESATRLLKDAKYENYSLSFIGQLSGFKCDRTMYRAFVKFKGESPSKCRIRN